MNRVRRTLMLSLIALFPLAPAAAAETATVESLVESLGESPRRVTDEVQTTLIYDDGEADEGTRPTSPNDLEYAMRFTAPDSPNQLLAFSVCLQRLPGDPSAGQFGVNVYADGVGGPGALLRSFDATVSGVAATLNGSFHAFDVSAFDVEVGQSFYIGVLLDSLDNDFFLCLDYDGVAGNRPVYASTNSGPWLNYRNADADVKAMMIRAVVDSQDAPPGACNAGGDAVFLLGGRFRFDACWRTSTNSGTAKLASQQGTGATLWFFNPDNPELFLKVRDACVNPFNRYWVFAAGLTNVEVTLTVTDTLRGFSKTYMNPLNTAFTSVQDTEAFATCP